ncbi:uncharacterized protein SAMN05192588_0671 [Nonlabens sp. Hel1_33_55]|uniref:DUF418 domain-containing protein n=1 Tax=Nonlabens sp. Hel1_33_55 TaxID=1336802 RepID=UPI000875E197|nr:DUF418 domain-containing protein [Nonlabens sp. Hel1_33_55]SCY00212.1 uncharacterized protein SAMN05192588_0671 [Nonlabens sp. Hel1_33_55]
MSNKSNISKPVKNSQRIEILDIYRGFALMGIFVVNITIMNSTFLNQDEYTQKFTSTLDLMTGKILQLFFYTKFFPIFSLLFGLGIAMQAIKILERKKSPIIFFSRKMIILFIIGVMHILFLWSGDVLNLYAIIGLFTILLLKLPSKLILALSVLFLIFPFYNQAFEFIFDKLNYSPELYLSGYTGETVSHIIKNGTYIEGLKLRVLEYLANIPVLFQFLAPIAIAMFLLGLYLGKLKVYQSLDSFIKTITIPVLIVTLLSNVYRVLFLFIIINHQLFTIEDNREIFIKVMVVSDVLMGLFYLWIIGWLYYNTTFAKVLKSFRFIGRMALTNYIFQSFIGLITFSSIGFQLYETLSPFDCLLVAVTVFIVQIILSKIWLKYFLYGPLEWMWRSLTYGTLLQIKR